MAIPEKPLELNIDLQELTLEDVSLFSAEFAQKDTFAWVREFSAFLNRYSTSWTADEIKQIKIKELEEVADQLLEAMQKAAVPLASLPR